MVKQPMKTDLWHGSGGPGPLLLNSQVKLWRYIDNDTTITAPQTGDAVLMDDAAGPGTAIIAEVLPKGILLDFDGQRYTLEDDIEGDPDSDHPGAVVRLYIVTASTPQPIA
ncbi:hypothetical protein ACO2I3_18990 [Leptospira interrogans]